LKTNSIEEFPEADLEELIKLDISKNKLSAFPSNLKAMKSLKKLQLAHNQINVIPSELGNGQLLEELDLSWNNLEGDITFDFQKIRMLNKLNLSNNKIKSVTNTIAKMEYLWELDIGNNEFQTFQRLPSTIRKLNVSMNPWKLSDPVYESHRNTFLLSVVDNLKDLTHLNFSGIGLNEIPKVIENFIGLKVVDLSNNEITEIDGAIFNQFRYVSKLDLSQNKILCLPKQVRCMQHLQYLDLSENEFEEFSQDFGVLRALRIFNISKNKISSMPSDLNEMVCLRDFNISNNKIDHLPHEKIDCLSSLRKLEAAQNQISSIPTEYENLHIEHLDLSNNIIRELPGLRNFKTIRTLLLADNDIENVPESIEKMSLLKKVDLSGNKVKYWPKCFAGMSNVEILRENQQGKGAD